MTCSPRSRACSYSAISSSRRRQRHVRPVLGERGPRGPCRTARPMLLHLLDAQSLLCALATSSRCTRVGQPVESAASSAVVRARARSRLRPAPALRRRAVPLAGGAGHRRPRSGRCRPAGSRTPRQRPRPRARARAPARARRARSRARVGRAARAAHRPGRRTARARSSPCAPRAGPRPRPARARLGRGHVARDGPRARRLTSGSGPRRMCRRSLEVGRAPSTALAARPRASARCSVSRCHSSSARAGLLPEPAELLVDRRDRGVGLVERGQRLVGARPAGRPARPAHRPARRQLARLALGRRESARPRRSPTWISSVLGRRSEPAADPARADQVAVAGDRASAAGGPPPPSSAAARSSTTTTPASRRAIAPRSRAGRAHQVDAPTARRRARVRGGGRAARASPPEHDGGPPAVGWRSGGRARRGRVRASGGDGVRGGARARRRPRPRPRPGPAAARRPSRGRPALPRLRAATPPRPCGSGRPPGPRCGPSRRRDLRSALRSAALQFARPRSSASRSAAHRAVVVARRGRPRPASSSPTRRLRRVSNSASGLAAARGRRPALGAGGQTRDALVDRRDPRAHGCRPARPAGPAPPAGRPRRARPPRCARSASASGVLGARGARPRPRASRAAAPARRDRSSCAAASRPGLQRVGIRPGGRSSGRRRGGCARSAASATVRAEALRERGQPEPGLLGGLGAPVGASRAASCAAIALRPRAAGGLSCSRAQRGLVLVGGPREGRPAGSPGRRRRGAAGRRADRPGWSGRGARSRPGGRAA